jgi:hypothetical protein
MLKRKMGVVVVGVLLGAQVGLAAASESAVPLGAEAIGASFEPPVHTIQYNAQQQSNQQELQLQQQELQLQQQQLQLQQQMLQRQLLQQQQLQQQQPQSYLPFALRGSDLGNYETAP